MRQSEIDNFFICLMDGEKYIDHKVLESVCLQKRHFVDSLIRASTAVGGIRIRHDKGLDPWDNFSNEGFRELFEKLLINSCRNKDLYPFAQLVNHFREDFYEQSSCWPVVEIIIRHSLPDEFIDKIIEVTVEQGKLPDADFWKKEIDPPVSLMGLRLAHRLEEKKDDPPKLKSLMTLLNAVEGIDAPNLKDLPYINKLVKELKIIRSIAKQIRSDLQFDGFPSEALLRSVRSQCNHNSDWHFCRDQKLKEQSTALIDHLFSLSEKKEMEKELGLDPTFKRTKKLGI